MLCRAALIAALIFPLPAWALSCPPASFDSDFRRTQASDDLYLIARGTLMFDVRSVPRHDPDRAGNPPASTDIKAFFKGSSLSRRGFHPGLRVPVTLRLRCRGHRCATPLSGIRYLAFLKREGDDYVITASPCPGMLYPEPTPDLLETAQRCMAGGPCEPPHRD
ncbi:hypothetical protein VK792_05390 [Mesobacterium sp. TK19101]|uniref:Lipoprotein n=1 Tax=Mesobacterium hydrothermale TaxID=3111907 RepID=A0ABU6HFT7_9RHOB|nr:hypothetical protein [Mesobacterium sp. TK19101]MEC3860710.1 hypothetical protein [Mesobacterium sp. TK19101]